MKKICCNIKIIYKKKHNNSKEKIPWKLKKCMLKS